MKISFPPIRKIDIEIHSYCNRRCEFCSNSVYNRNFFKILPDKLFSKVINELKDNYYSGIVFFTRYNEPFYKRELLEKRINEVRKKLPNNKIGVNTNGDFGYQNIDVNYLTIMDYDNNKQEMCDEEKGIRIMRLRNICNRGNILKSYSQIRDFPCYEPNYTTGIDYMGNIYFCCNTRIENKNHKSFVFGNIKEISIKDAYYSSKAIEFRNNTNKMKFPYICKYCSMRPSRFSKKNPSLCDNMEMEGI
jgi:radical SAM protein with 4Fe4S-binding SPASM domain